MHYSLREHPVFSALVRRPEIRLRFAGSVHYGPCLPFLLTSPSPLLPYVTLSLGDFGVLVYPPSGVARLSHCTPALLSIVMSFDHCTDHCTTGSVAGGA